MLSLLDLQFPTCTILPPVPCFSVNFFSKNICMQWLRGGNIQSAIWASGFLEVDEGAFGNIVKWDPSRSNNSSAKEVQWEAISIADCLLCAFLAAT